MELNFYKKITHYFYLGQNSKITRKLLFLHPHMSVEDILIQCDTCRLHPTINSPVFLVNIYIVMLFIYYTCMCFNVKLKQHV